MPASEAEFIHKANIEHLRCKLETETDLARRRTLVELLEAQLDAATRSEKSTKAVLPMRRAN